MKIRHWLILFSSLNISLLAAQERLSLPESDATEFAHLLGRWTAADLFGGYRNVQDEAMAAQIYSGSGVGFATVNTKVTHQQFKLYENRFAYHRLQPASETVTQDFWTNFSYQSLWQLKTFTQLTAIGVQGDILAQVRLPANLGNSFLHWEIAGTFGIATHLQRGKRGKINYYFNCFVPLVGYVNRPRYNILLKPSTPQDHGVGIIGRLFRIAPKFGILLPFKSGNYWGIFYCYDYFRWRDSREFVTRTAGHQLGMNIQFRKKNK